MLVRSGHLPEQSAEAGHENVLVALGLRPEPGRRSRGHETRRALDAEAAADEAHGVLGSREPVSIAGGGVEREEGASRRHAVAHVWAGSVARVVTVAAAGKRPFRQDP